MEERFLKKKMARIFVLIAHASGHENKILSKLNGYSKIESVDSLFGNEYNMMATVFGKDKDKCEQNCEEVKSKLESIHEVSEIKTLKGMGF